MPGFKVDVELNENMAKFAKLWPDSLGTREPLDDLGYQPMFGLSEMVKVVLHAHGERSAVTRSTFQEIDANVDGVLQRSEVESFLRGHMVNGREKHGWVIRRQDIISELIDQVMGQMDRTGDGVVRMPDFEQWSKVHSLRTVDDVSSMVDDFLTERVARATEADPFAT